MLILSTSLSVVCNVDKSLRALRRLEQLLPYFPLHSRWKERILSSKAEQMRRNIENHFSLRLETNRPLHLSPPESCEQSHYILN